MSSLQRCILRFLEFSLSTRGCSALRFFLFRLHPYFSSFARLNSIRSIAFSHRQTTALTIFDRFHHLWHSRQTTQYTTLFLVSFGRPTSHLPPHPTAVLLYLLRYQRGRHTCCKCHEQFCDSKECGTTFHSFGACPVGGSCMCSSCL